MVGRRNPPRTRLIFALTPDDEGNQEFPLESLAILRLLAR